MKEEYWKGVIGYLGLYKVSSKGRVRSLDVVLTHPITKEFTRKGRILKEERTKGGYIRYALSKDGKTERFMAHRLVASTFLENPQNLPFINHKDEVKHNNTLENLEWCTDNYNLEYSLARYYLITSPLGEEHKVFNLSEFCRDNQLHIGAMSEMATGRTRSDGRNPRKHHKGWKCRYEEDSPKRGVNKNEC